ncbi:TPA: hypothetical protein ACIC40_004488, partial [Escherichia coli]
LIANHSYSDANSTLCFCRGFLFLCIHFYSLYTIFFGGTGDGITLKVYSHTVMKMVSIRVNCAYRYKIKKPKAAGQTVQGLRS